MWPSMARTGEVGHLGQQTRSSMWPSITRARQVGQDYHHVGHQTRSNTWPSMARTRQGCVCCKRRVRVSEVNSPETRGCVSVFRGPLTHPRVRGSSRSHHRSSYAIRKIVGRAAMAVEFQEATLTCERGGCLPPSHAMRQDLWTGDPRGHQAGPISGGQTPRTADGVGEHDAPVNKSEGRHDTLRHEHGQLHPAKLVMHDHTCHKTEETHEDSQARRLAGGEGDASVTDDNPDPEAKLQPEALEMPPVPLSRSGAFYEPSGTSWNRRRGAFSRALENTSSSERVRHQSCGL